MSKALLKLAVAGVQRANKQTMLSMVEMEGRDIILDECYVYAKSMSNPSKNLKK